MSLDGKMVAKIAGLRLPMKETSLKKIFAELEKKLPDKSPEALKCLKAKEADTILSNIDEVIKLLKQECQRLLDKEVLKSRGISTPEKLSFLKISLDMRLKKLASDYVDTAKRAEELAIEAISASGIRQSRCKELIDNVSKMIPMNTVETIYKRCHDCLLTGTLFQIRQSRERYGPIPDAVFEHFQGGLSVVDLPELVVKKLWHRVAKHHLVYLKRVVVTTFNEEIQIAEPGVVLDHDLDPQSSKGMHLMHVASIALLVQPWKHLSKAEMLLAKVLDMKRYESRLLKMIDWQTLLQCVCRLYIGVLGLSKRKTSEEVYTTPKVYEWLQKVLQIVYHFPRATPYYENCFLNTLNEAAAELLISQQKHFDNLHYYVPNLRPCTRQNSSFFDQISEFVKFTHSKHSLLTLLNIGGPISAGEQHELCASSLDVAIMSLLWREESILVRSVFKFASLPFSLVKGWLVAIPAILSLLVDVANDFSETRNQNRIRAQNIGAYLGMLIARRIISNRFISMFGFCIGAEIVLSCLTELGQFNRTCEKTQRVYLMDVLLILGTVGEAEIDWKLVREPVKGRFINFYYRQESEEWKQNPIFTSSLFQTIQTHIGFAPMNREGIKNVNLAKVDALLSKQHEDTTSLKTFKKLAKIMEYYL